MAVVIAITAACARTETSTAPLTSTAPGGTSTAPSSGAARHRDEALVRAVNAVPFGSNFDLFAGDLALFDGLAFKTVTPYRALDGQRYAFALRPAGMTQAKPLDGNTEGLADGSFYTAIALPGDGRTPRLRIVNDVLNAPSAGNARVRIIHAGVDAGRISIRPAGGTTNIAEGVEYQSVTDYREVPPVSGTIHIVGADAAAPPLASFNTHMDAGRHYTIVIVGNARSAPALEAFLIEDALSP